jgi:formylmethanofuran dehydrogenase subunit E
MAKLPLGDGKASICNVCEEPYYEIQRLPEEVGLCPTCFEEKMNGEL